MPLRALLGKFTVWADNLTEADRGKAFRCPFCDEPLIAVLPKANIINHFRHKSGIDHGEPETPEHLHGKTTMRNLFQRYGWHAEIEVKVGRSAFNIADIVANKHMDIFAIEFQCSRISLDHFEQRNNRYEELGLTPVWVLGNHYFVNTSQFTDWARPSRISYYQIQRISKLETQILERQKLCFFNGKNFFIAWFKRRYKAKYLGWYTVRHVSFTDLLQLLETGDLFLETQDIEI